MLVCDVTQRRFGVLDRTDAAEDVIEDFTGALLKDFVVAALERYIVGIADQQDDIAVLAEIQRFNDALIERIAQPRVAQMGAAQPLQQTMFVTVFDLRGAEFDIQKIFSEGAGKRFLEQFEVKLCFLLFHQAD